MNTLVAGCKINLGLRITGRRPDGYHELDSLFCPLPRPCDRLRLRITEGSGLRVLCDTPDLNPEDNTLTRAYAAFAAATGAGRRPCRHWKSLCARAFPWGRAWAAAAAMPRPFYAGSMPTRRSPWSTRH